LRQDLFGFGLTRLGGNGDSGSRRGFQILKLERRMRGQRGAMQPDLERCDTATGELRQAVSGHCRYKRKKALMKIRAFLLV
jgi:hypothetical protein